jgi:hypothetical protein
MQKESQFLVFPSAIRFFLKSKEQVCLQSFLSRDTCFSFILSLMTQRGLLAQAQQSSYLSSSHAEKMASRLYGFYDQRKQRREKTRQGPITESQLMESATLLTEEKDSLFPNCFDSAAWAPLIRSRLQQTQQLIPDYDDFEFPLHSAEIPNVTLKHVIDLMYCPLPVRYLDGLMRPSLMIARLEASESHDITVPKCFVSLPAAWMDW